MRTNRVRRKRTRKKTGEITKKSGEQIQEKTKIRKKIKPRKIKIRREK